MLLSDRKTPLPSGRRTGGVVEQGKIISCRDTPCRYISSTSGRCRRGRGRCASQAAAPPGNPSDQISSAGRARLRQGFDAAHPNAWTRLSARLAAARIGRIDRFLTGRDTPCRYISSTSGRCHRGRGRCGRFLRPFWAAFWAGCRRRPRFPPCPWPPVPV